MDIVEHVEFFSGAKDIVHKPSTTIQAVGVDLLSKALVGMLLASVISFGVISLVNKDTFFVEHSPAKFVYELLMLSVCALAPVLFLFWTRSGSLPESVWTGIGLVLLKVLVAHLVLQFSGAYTYLFDLH